jgi:hypothetical protein
MFKRALLAAVFLSTLGGISASASAEVLVRVAPPQPRMERVPEARRGYQWAPGHWEWRHQRHVWVGGSWLRDRPGYSYQPHAWVERDGRWAMQGGRWQRGGRDRDHDGVPNRRDHDRDGDGVPNNRDARPNNPYVR